MSPDLIARSKNALIKSVSDTLPREAVVSQDVV